MYTVSEVVEMGKAHEMILSEIKYESIIDDSEPMSLSCEDVFD